MQSLSGLVAERGIKSAVDLGAPEDSTPRRDVRDAIRLICELAIGRQPPGARVDDEQLLGHIQLLAVTGAGPVLVPLRAG